jgi:diguanylate cyclase (GGDEF)-like protein
MIIFLLLTMTMLAALLLQSYKKNSSIQYEMRQLIRIREAALDIANRVVNTNHPTDLYQYILDTCLKLIPKAKFGSILMFNSEGLLVAKASVGFNQDEITNFKLKLEESFLYIATEGNPNRTVIINRLEDIVLEKNIVNSGDSGFALRSEVSAPLFINKELVGLLCIDGDENDIFTEQDIYILDYMSNQISIIINNQKLYQEIFYLSKYDSLTNLLNRSCFDKEAALILNSRSLQTENMYFILIDLDNLKEANDTLGHSYGDEVIKTFSMIISNHLGKNELCGRYGGDEFVAIFHDDPIPPEEKLEIIKFDFLASQNIFTEEKFVPNFSFGIAAFREGFYSLDTLYRLADMRMYQMKSLKKS